jgi:hypothetical protein
MALCITHTNKTDTTYPLQVIIKDGKKDVETVGLGPNQEVWIEAHTITSSLRVYQRKGLITIKEDRGVQGVKFLTPYTIGEIVDKKVKADFTAELKQVVKEEVIIPEPIKDNPLTENSAASMLDKASKQVEEYTKPKELKTGKWEEEELTYLRRYYPAKGAKFVAEKLNRGEKSVSKKAEALKVKRKRK